MARAVRRRVVVTISSAATLSILTGCSGMPKSHDLGYTPEVRDVSSVKNEAQGLSSQLHHLMALDGKTTNTGPGVDLCDDEDPDHLYVVRHPWSLYGVPVEDMKKAMEQLKVELPRHDWKIVKFGPDSSPSKSLEIVANSTKGKFSVNITLYDRRKKSGNAPSASKVSIIAVDLASACFRVPHGKTVDQS
ncbi:MULTISPECIES: hypothetical protein [unclassified Streptomyces]|uniref:hypothetical protein n=1 Tax=unclassified Streptomyces TaxID=2593676 RepID=UPI002E13B3B5|nr:hypothetical protein OG452_23140 [Streptomyces sp. NBC_01197]WSS49322.1 hypothetical protein OG708_12155 [Streptomyces sp. NBC_01180]